MTRLLIRRLAFMALTLWFVSLTIFVVTEVLPGDVATAILGQEATPADLARVRQRLGLDRPLVVRYGEWIAGAVRGDLGQSLRCQETIGINCAVTTRIGDRLPNSLVLAGLTLLVGVPLALALGIIAGLYRGTWLDGAISTFTLAGVSVPEFVSGVALILIFATWLQWLPPASSTRVTGTPIARSANVSTSSNKRATAATTPSARVTFWTKQREICRNMLDYSADKSIRY